MSARALAAPADGSEAALSARWAAGLRGPLRLEDGRSLNVVFPGVPGGGSGPDFVGAILDAGGDLLRGDVEVHLLASGWRAHGHHEDPAYGAVVLHVVGVNDADAPLTAHRCGRLIPVLVAPPQAAGFPPPFTPPCAVAVRAGLMPGPALDRLGLRRLRIKANRAAPVVSAHGPGQALYALLLETLGGPGNREAFASLARTLPLGHLLESADEPRPSRALVFAAHLKGRAAGLTLRRAGLRPMASPGRRLDAAGALFARLWPAGAPPGFPPQLPPQPEPGALAAPGIGRALAIECWVNAVLPVALAAGAWPESACESAFLALPSPGTYGRLKPLARWLAGPGAGPFPSAGRLQVGLLLHADYCSRGMCGRCPLSE